MKTKYLAVSIVVILGFVALFAKSGGCRSAAPRGLSQLHHCCRVDHALQALTLGAWEHSNWYVFVRLAITAGSFNTAVGAGALDLNTADSNTATGAAALLFNTTGTENTANGTAALEFNDIGFQQHGHWSVRAL